MTDPARELAAAITQILSNSDAAGDVHLAERFGVEAWSNDFFQILSALSRRIEEVCVHVANLELDAEEVTEITSHIGALREAFSKGSLVSNWNQTGLRQLAAHRIQALKGVSLILRRSISYPRLTDDERLEVLAMVADLLSFLRDHQLRERDFIRGALIEGLESFSFRLEKVIWFGWGYTVESLRAVIGAYFALERGEVEGDPNYEAMLLKVGAAMKAIFTKLRTVKDVADIGQMALAAYGAYGLATQPTVGISGLLTHVVHNASPQ